MKVINVPIEPYELRYTEQWLRWFPEAFKKLNMNYITILGERLTSAIETGQVLDVYGTNYYKMEQLKLLIKMIHNDTITDDDIIFINDLWFPGLEALQYIRNLTRKNFRIWGMLHDGSYDRKDFTFYHNMRPWAKYIEMGWFSFVDKIFLGSEFHKQLLLKGNYAIEEELDAKLEVTGFPVEYPEVQRFVTKKNIVVFPHRIDKEKRPDLFDMLSEELAQKYPHWQFIKTGFSRSKNDYYKFLSECKIAISYAELENFGISMLEAIANKCTAIVPNGLSYATMPIYQNTFNSFAESFTLVTNFMQLYDNGYEEKFNTNIKYFLTENVVQRMFCRNNLY